MHYAPVWNTLLDSSVWIGTSKETKILWVTMLLMKDYEGEVHSNILGLARNACLSLEEAQKAIAELESPDAMSTTPANEGRRVEKCEGGWRVLNHYLYLDKISILRQKNAERQRRWRKRRIEKLNGSPLKNNP